MICQRFLEELVQLAGRSISLDLPIPLLPIDFEEPFAQLRELFRRELLNLFFELLNPCHACRERFYRDRNCCPPNGPFAQASQPQATGRPLVRNQIDILGHSDERDLVAAHGEVDPLGHAVLVSDHVLRQLVLDVALDGPAQRSRTGV